MPSDPVHPTAAIWGALREIQDPEFPISLVDMGLIVSADYEPVSKTAQLQITYTAMGCPATEMIQEEIRGRLLALPGVEQVDIAVVWGPAWTRRRLSATARRTLRQLGIAP